MRVVIDTNVVISGVFFNGKPRKVILAVARGELEGYASVEILDEYKEIVDEMISRKQGTFKSDVLTAFIKKLNLIDVTTKVSACRDIDDNKFIECAIDINAHYIVSGDKDLLVLKEYGDIPIITAAAACELFNLKD